MDENLRNSISTFNSILENQTNSIKYLAHQYKNSEFSQQQLKTSLNLLNESLLKDGKIVISGIGKSHKIASKIVATLNSLSLHAALLHPSEALHGDLGILRENDVLILISSSGRSPELLQLLPHISLSIPIILLTNKKNSLLSTQPQVKSLLYAELPPQFSEESIYGLTAPTISTTLCLTLADAVSVALVELYISDINDRKKLFSERHPGGAIGEAFLTSQLSHQDSISSFLEVPSNSNLVITTENLENLNKSVKFDLEFNDEIEEVLNIDKDLIIRIKSSKNVAYINQFFKNEYEILSAIALFDYIVINQTMCISTDVIKTIYRLINEHKYETNEERINELTWRIKERLYKFE